MKAETKKSLKNNAVIISYSLIIIVVLILSDAIKNWSGPGTVELAIFIMVVLILTQIFSHALQNESKETRNKIRMMIVVVLIILAFLGVAAFFFYRLS